jgi:hypothetical protein
LAASPLEDLVARDAFGEPLAIEAPPVPAGAPPGKLAQPRLEPVVVATAHRLAPTIVVDEARHVRDVAGQVVVGILRLVRQGREGFEGLHRGVDRGHAVPARAPPGRVEVAVIHQGRGRRPQRVARTPRVRSAWSSTEHAPDALGWIGQGALEPAVEGSTLQALRLFLGRHLEAGIHSRLHGPLVQEVCAEGVDRSDAGQLELLEGALEARALGAALGCESPCGLDSAAQPQLHLSRGLLGERHRHHTLERPRTRAQQGHDAVHQRRGLSRAGGGLDEERRVEILPDTTTRLCVGQDRCIRSHGSALSRSRGASRGCHFRPARISS